MSTTWNLSEMVQANRSVKKITKNNIEEIKSKLTYEEALIYRCWKKNIIHEVSAKDMGGEIIEKIIHFEGTKITSFGYNLKN